MLTLNGLWKHYQDRFKCTGHHENMLKYYECDHSLSLIKERLAKMDALLNKPHIKCKLNNVVRYQDEMQRACSDVESMNTNLNLIVKLTNKIDFDQNQKLKDAFAGDIKNTDAKLIQLKYIMPDYMARLNRACGQLRSIEAGLCEIEFWVIEGDNMLKVEPEQLSSEHGARQIEKIKVSVHLTFFFKLLNQRTRSAKLILLFEETFSRLQLQFERSAEQSRAIPGAEEHSGLEFRL